MRTEATDGFSRSRYRYAPVEGAVHHIDPVPGGRTTDGGTAGILFEAGMRRRGGLIETADTDEVGRLRLLRVIRDLRV